MTFEGEDFDGLMGYLDAHPAMREELRRRILDDEFLRLPAEVRELRISIHELRDAVRELATGQERITAQLAALTDVVEALTANVKRQDIRVDRYVGPMYEMLFRQKAPSLFGEWLRRPHVVDLDEVPGFEDQEAAGAFSDSELVQLRALDLLVRGGDKHSTPLEELFLAVEVSATVDASDVERAAERARLLGRTGVRTRAAVAGTAITARAERLARSTGTLVRLVNDVA